MVGASAFPPTQHPADDSRTRCSAFSLRAPCRCLLLTPHPEPTSPTLPCSDRLPAAACRCCSRASSPTRRTMTEGEKLIGCSAERCMQAQQPCHHSVPVALGSAHLGGTSQRAASVAVLAVQTCSSSQKCAVTVLHCTANPAVKLVVRRAHPQTFSAPNVTAMPLSYILRPACSACCWAPCLQHPLTEPHITVPCQDSRAPGICPHGQSIPPHVMMQDGPAPGGCERESGSHSGASQRSAADPWGHFVAS